MRLPKLTRRWFPAVLFALAAASGAAFLWRQPLVVVSDEAGEALYGEARASAARLMLSLRTFRRVSLALVSETAAPESASDAAEAAVSPRGAFAVFFPSRYVRGADVFAARFSSVRTVVVGDAPAGGAAVRVVPDREADLYRAGRIARASASAGASLALGSGIADPDAARASFADGLDAVGGAPFPPAPESSGASLPFLFTVDLVFPSGETGAVVCSWLDPRLLPRRTVAVFDDSLYALAAEAYGAALRSAAREVGSRVRVPFPSEIPLEAYFRVQAAARARRH